MKTADTLIHQLADGEILKTNQGRLEFVAGASRWTLSCDSESLDSVGGRFRKVRLDRSLGAPSQSLDARAAITANRLTGMLESIKLVEVDQQGRIAQLRSSVPAIRGTARHYYELQIQDANAITLERFQFDSAAGKREAIPFTLTYDALAKLVDDLTND